MITLRFVSHPGIFNRLCSFAQYGFWCSHVEAVMPDSRLLGAMSTDGVQARSPDYDVGTFLREQFLPVESDGKQESIFYDFLRSQIDKPYDAMAITAFFFARDWQEPDSWTCSELIASGLAACGIFQQHLAVTFSRITVRDVFLLASPMSAGG